MLWIARWLKSLQRVHSDARENIRDHRALGYLIDYYENVMHENLLKWMDFNRFVWLVDMIMSSILGLYLGVRTCEHFHCVAPLGSILLTSLFYVTREFYRFLHQGWTNCSFLEMGYIEGFLIGLIYDVSLWSRLIDDHDIYHWLLTPVLSACMRHNVPFTMWGTNYKQLLDEVFVISRIIKVEVSVIL